MSTVTMNGGTEICAKDWGTGQPVVFSHGWPLTSTPPVRTFSSKVVRALEQHPVDDPRATSAVRRSVMASVSRAFRAGSRMSADPARVPSGRQG